MRTMAELSDWKHGGASRDRTDDLIVANDALSQLSYSPTHRATVILAEEAASGWLRRGSYFFTIGL